ncbi:hypothetical protein BJ508DRAFT_373888 [Ascobolus immersus RN42]|uniref:Uncharacterized protein n=1 Tax=Ascobolus immersus RN42 TaxID=1160509 RepID=A0A3N4IID5_ASCIM|nr:hypothetical protein BJ508DRAFT_373888 [Ascobolus immersus RN42]
MSGLSTSTRKEPPAFSVGSCFPLKPIFPPLPTFSDYEDDAEDSDPDAVICEDSKAMSREELMASHQRIMDAAAKYVRGGSLYIHSARLRGPVVRNPWAVRTKETTIPTTAKTRQTEEELSQPPAKRRRLQHSQSTLSIATPVGPIRKPLSSIFSDPPRPSSQSAVATSNGMDSDQRRQRIRTFLTRTARPIEGPTITPSTPVTLEDSARVSSTGSPLPRRRSRRSTLPEKTPQTPANTDAIPPTSPAVPQPSIPRHVSLKHSRPVDGSSPFIYQKKVKPVPTLRKQSEPPPIEEVPHSSNHSSPQPTLSLQPDHHQEPPNDPEHTHEPVQTRISLPPSSTSKPNPDTPFDSSIRSYSDVSKVEETPALPRSKLLPPPSDDIDTTPRPPTPQISKPKEIIDVPASSPPPNPPRTTPPSEPTPRPSTPPPPASSATPNIRTVPTIPTPIRPPSLTTPLPASPWTALSPKPLRTPANNTAQWPASPSRPPLTPRRESRVNMALSALKSPKPSPRKLLFSPPKQSPRRLLPSPAIKPAPPKLVLPSPEPVRPSVEVLEVGERTFEDDGEWVETQGATQLVEEKVVEEPEMVGEEVLEVGERTFAAVDEEWVETQGRTQPVEEEEEKDKENDITGDGTEEPIVEEKEPQAVEEVVEVGERTFDATDDTWLETQGDSTKPPANEQLLVAEETPTEKEEELLVGEKTFAEVDGTWITEGRTVESQARLADAAGEVQASQEVQTDEISRVVDSEASTQVLQTQESRVETLEEEEEEVRPQKSRVETLEDEVRTVVDSEASTQVRTQEEKGQETLDTEASTQVLAVEEKEKVGVEDGPEVERTEAKPAEPEATSAQTEKSMEPVAEVEVVKEVVEEIVEVEEVTVGAASPRTVETGEVEVEEVTVVAASPVAVEPMPVVEEQKGVEEEVEHVPVVAAPVMEDAMDKRDKEEVSEPVQEVQEPQAEDPMEGVESTAPQPPVQAEEQLPEESTTTTAPVEAVATKERDPDETASSPPPTTPQQEHQDGQDPDATADTTAETTVQTVVPFTPGPSQQAAIDPDATADEPEKMDTSPVRNTPFRPPMAANVSFVPETPYPQPTFALSTVQETPVQQQPMAEPEAMDTSPIWKTPAHLSTIAEVTEAPTVQESQLPSTFPAAMSTSPIHEEPVQQSTLAEPRYSPDLEDVHLPSTSIPASPESYRELSPAAHSGESPGKFDMFRQSQMGGTQLGGGTQDSPWVDTQFQLEKARKLFDEALMDTPSASGIFSKSQSTGQTTVSLLEPGSQSLFGQSQSQSQSQSFGDVTATPQNAQMDYPMPMSATPTGPQALGPSQETWIGTQFHLEQERSSFDRNFLLDTPSVNPDDTLLSSTPRIEETPAIVQQKRKKAAKKTLMEITEEPHLPDTPTAPKKPISKHKTLSTPLLDPDHFSPFKTFTSPPAPSSPTARLGNKNRKASPVPINLFTQVDADKTNTSVFDSGIWGGNERWSSGEKENMLRTPVDNNRKGAGMFETPFGQDSMMMGGDEGDEGESLVRDVSKMLDDEVWDIDREVERMRDQAVTPVPGKGREGRSARIRRSLGGSVKRRW